MENHIPSVVLAAVAAGTLYFAGSIGGSGDTAQASPEKAAAEQPSPTPQAVAQAPAPQVQPVAAPTPAPSAPSEAKAAPVAQPVKPEAPKPVPSAPTPAPKPVAKPAPTPAPAAPVARPSVALNPDDAPPTVNRDGAKRSTDASRPPAYGPDLAKAHVIVISDFQCPVCRRATEATHQLANEFPGEVRVEFWNHALKMHRNAENAAAAALAAQRQGKFWEMHDVLFSNQSALDETSLKTYAQNLGLDMAKFNADYQDAALRERIKAEGEFASALGARGTPAFLVNGKLSVGWGSWNGFRGSVERELTQAKSLTGKSPLEAHTLRAKENAKSPEDFERYKKMVLDPLAKLAK